MKNKKLTLEERLNAFKEKGWTCDKEGNVYSHTGKLINRINNCGYIQCLLKIDKITYVVQSHQLVWYLNTGRIPKILDHINRIRTDNRFDNLREVTNQENCFNQKAKGYCWREKNKKYQAYIKINNKSINLGYFDIEEEAHQAYLNAKKIYHIIYE